MSAACGSPRKKNSVMSCLMVQNNKLFSSRYLHNIGNKMIYYQPNPKALINCLNIEVDRVIGKIK